MNGAPAHRPDGLSRQWGKTLSEALRGVDSRGGDASPPSGLGWTTGTRSLKDLNASRDLLKAVVARDMRESVHPGLAEECIGELSTAIDDIFAAAVPAPGRGASAKTSSRVSQAAFERAVVDANRHAQEFMTAVERREIQRGAASGAPVTRPPEFFLRKNFQVNVLRSAPSLEGMVFRGGGAKGVGYAPSLAVMEEQGQLQGLKQVVGTSAGSLTALCMATGFSARQFGDFVGRTGMDELGSRIPGFARRYPTVEISGMCRHSGEGALVALDHASATSVASHLKSLWTDRGFQASLARLDPAQVARLNSLRHPDLSPGADRTSEMVTFSDLRLLHQLAPARFRELTITGWDATQEKLEYFSADSQPDMPVSIAARMSMAIPPLFDPVFFRLEDRAPATGPLAALRRTLGLGEEPKAHKFIDGGFGNNVPSEVFTEGRWGRELLEARARTAVLVFDEQGKAHDQLHTRAPTAPASGWKKFMRMATLLVKSVNNPNHAAVSEGDKRKPLEAGVNAFVIHHGDMDTFATGAGPARTGSAARDAELRMLRQVRQRQEQAYVVAYDNPQDCVDALSPAERQALAAAGEPVRAHGMPDELHAFQLAVYRLVSTPAYEGPGPGFSDGAASS